VQVLPVGLCPYRDGAPAGPGAGTGKGHAVGAVEFGRMVEDARRKCGYSRSELGRRLGRLPESGRVFDPSAVRHIVQGGPVRLDRELVDRLIEVLDLDPFDAYEAADLRPRDFTAEDHRTFVAAGGTRTAELPEPFTSRTAVFPARHLRLVAPAGSAA
jgi:Helix-turn-helix domain